MVIVQEEEDAVGDGTMTGGGGERREDVIKGGQVRGGGLCERGVTKV